MNGGAIKLVGGQGGSGGWPGGAGGSVIINGGTGGAGYWPTLQTPQQKIIEHASALYSLIKGTNEELETQLMALILGSKDK